jgi:predicted ATPase
MDARAILTPDQRLRVFVSSTLHEMVAERRAARRAIERLCLTPVMFELAARPHPPRTLYLAYLRQSHVFVGVYGDQYGWTAPDMAVSGLEDELRHASGLPLLLYVKDPAPGRDPRLTALVDQVAQAAGVSYKHFSNVDDLESLLAGDLAVLLSERFTGPVQGAMQGLPAPATEFIGRRAEVEGVASLLTSEAVRLVTLTGPGGIGKTRLALEVARAGADRFVDGVVFVSLVNRGPDDVLAAIGDATGLTKPGEPVGQTTIDGLRDRQCLLVLDNFEHLLPATRQVSDLLERAAGLRMLVTSRAALRVSGEEEFPVPPLSVPRVTDRVEEVLAAEAAQLFCRRASAVRRDFRLTDGEAATLAAMCQQLEGVPLALELVAARANVLSLRELAMRLDNVLDLPARGSDLPQRQRTLRLTMDWSYDQLPQHAHPAFARLGVFAGAFTLAAAEEVCEVEETDLLELIGVLVDHSLLRPHLDSGEARFSMLEMVRDYACSRLEPDAEQRARHRHARYYRAVALAAADQLRQEDQKAGFERLSPDLPDIGVALEWLVSRGRRAEAAEINRALWGAFDEENVSAGD